MPPKTSRMHSVLHIFHFPFFEMLLSSKSLCLRNPSVFEILLSSKSSVFQSSSSNRLSDVHPYGLGC